MTPFRYIGASCLIVVCTPALSYARDPAPDTVEEPRAVVPVPPSVPSRALLPAAEPPPDPHGQAGLVADLERIVSFEEDNGWFVERSSIETVYPTVMQTFCRTSEGGRQGAMHALAARSAQAGDAKKLYASAGIITGAVERALHIERMQNTLHAAIDGASKDCPFYIEAKPGYDGRQTDRNRFTLSLESGAIVQLRRTANTWGYGGGADVRILPGYGFGHFSLLTGIELAGGAMLRPGDASRFVVNYFPAIPVVLRLRSTMWHYDLEVAGVSLLQADNTSLSLGGRFGVAIGFSALKTRFLIPWAGIAAAYEYYAESGGRPAAHFLRGGFRIGFQWDP